MILQCQCNFCWSHRSCQLTGVNKKPTINQLYSCVHAFNCRFLPELENSENKRRTKFNLPQHSRERFLPKPCKPSCPLVLLSSVHHWENDLLPERIQPSDRSRTQEMNQPSGTEVFLQHKKISLNAMSFIAANWCNRQIIFQIHPE